MGSQLSLRIGMGIIMIIIMIIIIAIPNNRQRRDSTSLYHDNSDLPNLNILLLYYSAGARAEESTGFLTKAFLRRSTSLALVFICRRRC